MCTTHPFTSRHVQRDSASKPGSATMRDSKVLWSVSGSSVVVSRSYPQPPDRSQHGCIVGIDRDPPVRHLHPGWWRYYQSASSDVRQCWCWFLLYTWSLVVVLPCRTVCHRRSSSNDIACVVVRSRDSSYSVKSADSSTLTLCERVWAFVITTFHSSQ